MRRAAAFLALAISLGASSVAAAPPAPAPVAEGDPAAREGSRAAFREGVAALRASRWDEAREAFERAYTLFPHPSILLNRGLARQKAGAPVLAEEDFVRFLQEDTGASPEELASARDALAEVRLRLGTLRVTTTPRDAEVRVDGEPAAGGTARVVGGTHEVTVASPGFAPVTRRVEVPAREEVTVSVALGGASAASTSSARERGTTRTVLGLGAGGLGVVAIGVGTVAALRASSLADDYADPASSLFQDRGTRSDGITWRTTADVALGVAILSGAAAIVLLATDAFAPTKTVSRRALLVW